MFDFDDALENYVIRAKNSIRRSFFDHVVITAIAAVATLMAFSQIFILAELADTFQSVVYLGSIGIGILFGLVFVLMIISLYRNHVIDKKSNEIDKILTMRKFAKASSEPISTELTPGERIFEFAKRSLKSSDSSEKHISWTGTKTNSTNYTFDCVEEFPKIKDEIEDIVVGKHFGENLTSKDLGDVFLELMKLDISPSKNKPLSLFCVAKNIEDKLTDNSESIHVDIDDSENKVAIKEWGKNQNNLYILKEVDNLLLPVHMSVG